MRPLFTSFLVLLFLSGSAQPVETFTVNFDFDKYDINPRAREKLDSFLRSTTASSIKMIGLYGHCDSVGNNTYNDNLSMKRVTAVKNYLSKNFPSTVFKTLKGFGKRQPLNDNADEEERFRNRRVEIYVEKVTPKSSEQAAQKIPSKPQQTLSEKIMDTAIKTGTNIIVKNMNFYGGRHVLLPESLPTLTELLNVLQENPTLEIEIQGHICCTFGAEDGLDIDTNTPDLSVNRARAIYDYLVSHGIDANRLSYRGFGHRRPLVYPEDTEEKRTTNRRVEIRIIKK